MMAENAPGKDLSSPMREEGEEELKFEDEASASEFSEDDDEENERIQNEYLEWRQNNIANPPEPNMRKLVRTICLVISVAKKLQWAGSGREEKRRASVIKDPSRRTEADKILATELLASVKFFQGLSADQLQTLAAAVSFRIVERGEVVYTEREATECFYVVMQGSVSLRRLTTTRPGQPPRDVAVADIFVGESFGEADLTQGENSEYSTTATAKEDSELFVVDRPTYTTVFESAKAQQIHEIEECLKSLPLLRRLIGVQAGERALRAIALAVIERHVPKDTMVVQQGEENDTSFFYVVKSGCLKVIRVIPVPADQDDKHGDGISNRHEHGAGHYLTSPFPAVGRGGLNGGPASRQAHHLKLQKLMGTEVTDGFDPLEWHGTNHYQMRDSASWCNRHAVHQVPLEIDELTRGRFFVRNSWKIGSRAEAVASLVTNSETSIYILNKWDFMRTMEQFGFGRGSPLSEVLEQVTKYTDDHALIWEWKEGEHWEMYKSDLATNLLTRGPTQDRYSSSVKIQPVNHPTPELPGSTSSIVQLFIPRQPALKTNKTPLRNQSTAGPSSSAPTPAGPAPSEAAPELKPQPPPPLVTSEEPREIRVTMVHGVQKRQRSGRSILTDHSMQNSAVWLRRERLKQGFREGLDPLPSSGLRLPLSSTAPHTHRSAPSPNHTSNSHRSKSLKSRSMTLPRMTTSQGLLVQADLQINVSSPLPGVPRNLSSGILSDDLVFSELISNASRRFDDLELPPDPWMSARGPGQADAGHSDHGISAAGEVSINSARDIPPQNTLPPLSARDGNQAPSMTDTKHMAGRNLQRTSAGSFQGKRNPGARQRFLPRSEGGLGARFKQKGTVDHFKARSPRDEPIGPASDFTNLKRWSTQARSTAQRDMTPRMR